MANQPTDQQQQLPPQDDTLVPLGEVTLAQLVEDGLVLELVVRIGSLIPGGELLAQEQEDAETQ